MAGMADENGDRKPLHSAYYDMCFKATHLRSASPVPLFDDDRRPPNVVKTLDDSFVMDFINRYVTVR